MSTHDEYMTRRQARDLARRLARLERKTRSTAAAHADLRHSAIDGGKGLVLKDEQGQEKYRLGTDENGVTAPQYKGGPTPEQPSEPFVDVGGEVVKIQHSGLDVNEEPAPADFRRAQIHVSQDEVFEPGFSTLAGYLEEADGSFTHRLPGGEWYVGVVWETLSGKTSVMSGTVLADIPPLVDTSDLEDTLAAAQARLDEYRDEVAAPRFQALEDGLSENADNLADARTRLSAAEQTLSPLPGRIGEAETRVESAVAAAESAEARAVEASNNAGNRLQNGGFELGLDHWSITNVSLSDDAHTGNQAALIGSGGSLSPDASIPVSEGDVWDVSAYAKNGSALVVDVINSDDNTVLESFTTSTASSWSETGRLRVEVPANVSYMNIRITGDNTLVDDVVLRDVTDVVRLERAATAARQAAEQAIAELELLQLSVDGEGGLKDRLQSAESTLETKADESALDRLDQKLARNLAAFEAHYTRVWRQPTPPPPGVHYAWLGEPHASVSVRLDGDGNETARNYALNPSFENNDLSMFTTWFGEATTTSRFPGAFQSSGGLSGQNILEVEAAGDNYITSFFTSYSSTVPIPSGMSHGVVKAIVAHRTPPNIAMEVRLGVYYVTPSGRQFMESGYVSAPTWGGAVITFPHHIPEGATEVGYRIQWRSRDSAQNIPAGTGLYAEKIHLAVADSEEVALAQVATYFDGDTEDDRHNDLWYNTDGVPHEWVNGQGWTELSDDRINQLQTDVVEAAQTAYLDRLVVRDEIVTPETITNRLWADLGVFNRLEAREGWIGGTLLADGAVTAEKITATRELITKIMGAEWAYISERLIVDGSILTRDLEALSAAIQSLTVTQRADIAQLWAEELWTALAVIEELQAAEAWITSAMISELTAEKVTVTENFVGRVAELLHLVVDRIDANQLWADQTWQAAGHFGSEDADQKTEVDGTGVTLYRLIDGELIPAAQFGGGLTQLAFFDGNESVGSIDQHGNAAFQQLAANHLTVAGREVFPPNPAPDYEGYLFDALPRGIRDKAVVDMAGVSEPREAYGFLEVSAQVEAGREYRVKHTPFLMNTGEAYHGQFTYTFSDTGTPPDAPHTESDRIGTRWRIGGSVTEGAHSGGETVFTADQTGIMRILLNVRRNSGSGIHFHTSSLYANGITLTLEDIGPAKEYTGMRRYAAHGGGVTADRDNQSLLQGRVTLWTPTWQQTYRGTTGAAPRFSRPANTPAIQGRSSRTGGDWYATMLGGYTTTPGTGDDHGQTMQAALAGAHQVAGRLLFTGVAQEFAQSGPTVWYWHSENQAPQTLQIGSPPTAYPGNGYVGTQFTHAGRDHVIPIPAAMIDAIRDNTFRGITMHPVVPTGDRHQAPYHGVQGVLGNKPPTIELTIQR